MQIAKILLILILSLPFVTSADSETVRSDGGSSSTAKTANAEEGVVIDVKACPKMLVDWVKDDFTDKSTLKVFKFPSEVKSCTSAAKAYAEYAQKSGQKTELSEAESLSKYLANRYPQISASAGNSMNSCNALPNGQDKLVKTRYYLALEKFENYNTSIVNELAYIDSMIPSGSALAKLKCNPQFPFPNVAKRCSDYKQKMGATCKYTPEQRMDAMVSKSYYALNTIKKLEDAYKKCMMSQNAMTCADIQTVVQRISAENPWLNSRQFLQVRAIAKSNTNWEKNFDKNDMKKRISGYFNDTRDSLVKQYETNLKHVRCLTYTTSGFGSSNCKLENTRLLLGSIPDLPDLSDRRLKVNREFDAAIQGEKCLLERGADREKIESLIDQSAISAGVTIATAGLGVIAAGGLKITQGMSSVNRMRSAAGALTVTAGINLSVGVKDAIASCQKESEALFKFSSSSEAISENLCPDPYSKISQAYDAESSCVTDALLASANVWPFVKGLKMVGNSSKYGLAASFKDPKQREAVEAILAKNGQLSELERPKAAETMLGRGLSALEKNCVMSAHNTAPSKFMRTADTTDFPESQLLSQSELLAKKAVLSKCGFDIAEVTILMRSGITGAGISLQQQTVKNYEMAKKQIENKYSSNAKPSPYDDAAYGLLGRSAGALGKSDEMETAYNQAFNVRMKYLGLDKMKPSQAGAKLDSLSNREINDLADYAAATGKTEWITEIESRNLKAIETEARSRFRKSSLAEIKAGTEAAGDAVREYYTEQLKNSQSSTPAIKKMADERLRVLRIRYPGLK